MIILTNINLIRIQSAKTNQNVEQVFFTIARDIKQRLTETVAAATEVTTPGMLCTDIQVGNPICSIIRVVIANLYLIMQAPTIQISRQDPDQAGGAASRWSSSCCNT